MGRCGGGLLGLAVDRNRYLIVAVVRPSAWGCSIEAVKNVADRSKAFPLVAVARF